MTDKKEILETGGRSSSTLENGNHHYEDAERAAVQRSLQRQGTYEEHGPTIDHVIPQALAKQSNPDLLWPRIRNFMIEPFSEFWGVFILIMFGDGVVAQVVLSGGAKGTYQSISWGWGLGVMLGIYVAGKSGAHLNPAVTLANCVFRKHPWRKFPVYFMAQLLGGMSGSAVVYGNYRSAIDNLEGYNVRTVASPTNPNGTAGIFCTYPAPFMTKTGQFFSEYIASTLLMFLLFTVTDGSNIGGVTPGSNSLVPLCFFFIIFGIGACFGWETGYAINLARDFGPRLVSFMVGYGHEVWSAGGYYFWVPMVAPFFGCLTGGFLYDVFIYTGHSPINTPYWGLDRIFKPTYKTWSNTYTHKKEDEELV